MNTGHHSDCQCEQILAWPKKGNTITSLQALNKFGCLRLASRISDLKMRGVRISSVFITDTRTGKRYKIYYLSK